ncbi:hypothetical protein Bca4012_028147 [Brassica carinata]
MDGGRTRHSRVSRSCCITSTDCALSRPIFLGTEATSLKSKAAPIIDLTNERNPIAIAYFFAQSKTAVVVKDKSDGKKKKKARRRRKVEISDKADGWVKDEKRKI